MKRWAGSVAALVATGLVVAPGAAAHAELESTTPRDDAVLRAAPARVVLRFTEPVETAFGSIRVYDLQAGRVDTGRVSHPDEKTMAIALARNLRRGTYTTSWRVVSEDSHPISGTFVFHVRTRAATPEEVTAATGETRGSPRSVTVVFTAVRFLDFVLLLLVVGGTVALAYALQTVAAPLRRRLLIALAVWAVLLAVAAFLGIAVQGAKASGLGLGEAVDWGNASAVLETRFGKVWLFQAAAAGAVALLTLLASRAAIIPAAALAFTPSLSGHANVRGGLTLIVDVTHVGAAAVWTGGLGFVVVTLVAAGAARWPIAARAVPRFSRLAVASVAVLVVSGVVNGYEEVGTWHDLWDTTYGLLLVAKVALALPVIGLGAYNNRYAVPRLRDQIASPAEQRRFLRTVAAELAIIVAIVGVTSALVGEPPARAGAAPAAYWPSR